MRSAVGFLALLEAVSFLVSASVRLSGSGSGVVEPLALPAAVAESLCGIVLALAGWAALASKRGGWRLTVGAHAFALTVVLIGMVALAAGAGLEIEANPIYHRLVILVTMLILLATRSVRRAWPSAHVSASAAAAPGAGYPERDQLLALAFELDALRYAATPPPGSVVREGSGAEYHGIEAGVA